MGVSGAPLSPKAVDGTVGRLVGGRRGLYVARPDDFSVGGSQVLRRYLLVPV